MPKEILVCIGVHADAASVWLGDGGSTTLRPLSQGLFAGHVGIPRLLKLFERESLKTSWFIPGHTIESFPMEAKAVVEAGHEIGIHGYSHENPLKMNPTQEEAVLDKCIGLIKELTGKPPTG